MSKMSNLLHKISGPDAYFSKQILHGNPGFKPVILSTMNPIIGRIFFGLEGVL